MIEISVYCFIYLTMDFYNQNIRCIISYLISRIIKIILTSPSLFRHVKYIEFEFETRHSIPTKDFPALYQCGHVFKGVQECRLPVVLPLARPPPPSVPPLQNFLSPSKPLHPSTFTLPAPTNLVLLFPTPKLKVWKQQKERERGREEREKGRNPYGFFFRTASSPPVGAYPSIPCQDRSTMF